MIPQLEAQTATDTKISFMNLFEYAEFFSAKKESHSFIKRNKYKIIPTYQNWLII
jgi:hypothetical protein